MKLFDMLVGSTLGNSILQNVVMDPNDPNYSQKTAAILRLNGIDVNTDPFFAEDSIEVRFEISYSYNRYNTGW